MQDDRDIKYCKRIESICRAAINHPTYELCHSKYTNEQSFVYLKKNDKIIYIEKNHRKYDSTYGVYLWNNNRDAFDKAKKVLDSAITEYIAGVFKKYVLSKH